MWLPLEDLPNWNSVDPQARESRNAHYSHAEHRPRKPKSCGLVTRLIAAVIPMRVHLRQSGCAARVESDLPESAAQASPARRARFNSLRASLHARDHIAAISLAPATRLLLPLSSASRPYSRRVGIQHPSLRQRGGAGGYSRHVQSKRRTTVTAPARRAAVR